jgi:hypothetical protein
VLNRARLESKEFAYLVSLIEYSFDGKCGGFSIGVPSCQIQKFSCCFENVLAIEKVKPKLVLAVSNC